MISSTGIDGGSFVIGLSPVDRITGDDFGVGAGASVAPPVLSEFEELEDRGFVVLCGVIVGGPTDSGLCGRAVAANSPAVTTTFAHRAPTHFLFIRKFFTATSRVVGTPSYFAPDVQAQPQVYDFLCSNRVASAFSSPDLGYGVRRSPSTVG